MTGLLIPWVSRYTRHAVLTLGIVVLGLAAALSRSSLPVSMAVALATPTTPAIEQPGAPEWPRTVLRLWFFLPQFLPHDS